jgi:hypothetical protein
MTNKEMFVNYSLDFPIRGRTPAGVYTELVECAGMTHKIPRGLPRGTSFQRKNPQWNDLYGGLL